MIEGTDRVPLTDLLADPARNRFYVVQQDQDQVLVFDSTTYQQIAALKASLIE